MASETNVRFFRTPADFRKWLEKNYAQARELYVGFYNKQSGKKGMTYPEAVEEALCFGWIDGVRRKLDEDRYINRFSPRKAKSYWSDVNIRKMQSLIQQRRVAPPGLAAFEARDESETGKYSFESREQGLDADLEQRFRGNEKAWAYYESQAPWYRKTSAFWVMSAKKAETREKRLAMLIECSENGTTIPPLTRK
ncbi:MAG TPA: YdeI/OmpD-associated family protein [Thermoanaerobaculia bacterium]